MPLPIQALPKGLVAFLDLNTSGIGPGSLAEQAVATLDILPFISLAKRERIATGTVAAGTGAGDWNFSAASPSGVVAPNEAWLVFNYHVQASIALGLTAAIQPTFWASVAGGSTVIPVGPPVSNGSSALASVLRAPSYGVPFWMPPGAFLGGLTPWLSAATAFNAVGVADVVKFRL